ncbi:MAG: hypothetical protein IJ331_04050 [Ruminococcus sp.]|nr:hypothetical protein [Ruminococcus sp.]
MKKQNNNPYLAEQIKRLKAVFEYLKLKGISQTRVAKKFEQEINRLYEEDEKCEKLKVLDKVNDWAICEYKTGKRKNIPDEFLEFLHKEYKINPRYIRQESELMLTTINSKLMAFDELFSSWNTIERTRTTSKGRKELKKYLHLKLDKNFYDFMLEYGDTLLSAVDDGILTLEEGIKTLEKIYESEENLQEFVLIPCKDFKRIVAEETTRNKQFHEVIDIIEHIDYFSDDSETD